MNVSTAVVFLVALMVVFAPLFAAESGINNPTSTIDVCATPAPPQPTLIRDAIKAATKWQQKRAAKRIKGRQYDKSDIDVFTLGKHANPADIVLVGNFRAFFECVGAGNDLAEQVARQQRYVTMGPNSPIFLNYNEEIIGLVADYERSWIPNQTLLAGESPRYLRDMVASWLVAASELRAGKLLSIALQREYVYLRSAGIKPGDPNLRLLARRIAETAKAEMMVTQKPIRVNIAPATTLAAAR